MASSYQSMVPEYGGSLDIFRKPMKGHLAVTIIEAHDLYPKDKMSGKSDPYVKVGHGGSKKTKVIKKNLNPFWNETLECESYPIPIGMELRDIGKEMTLKPGHQLKFEVFDHDIIGKNDRMGVARVLTDHILANEKLDRWIALVPRKRKEKARGRIHIKVVFLTRDRPPYPAPPAPPPRYECAEPLFMAPPPAPVVQMDARDVEDEEDEKEIVDNTPPPPPASLQIWRIENNTIAEWPRDSYGTFFSGDSYIVLRTEYVPHPVSYIYTWIGRASTPDEVQAAHAKASELEKAVGGDASSSTQPQGAESSAFLSYFPNNALIYLEGGIDTQWRPEIKTPTVRLLQIKGKKNIRVTQAPLNSKGLNSGDCFILDAGMEIWQWNGKQCNPAERRKAGDILRGFINERTGKPTTHIMDEGDDDATFWAHLGGKGPVSTAAESGADDDVAETHAGKLFRLSDDHGHLQLSLVATGPSNNHTLLEAKDVFLFDAGVEIFVWIGKEASADEKKNAVPWANQYARDNQKAVPITRLLQGGESYYFKQAFSF
ncbi:hypothetical protein PROFUN_15769 [Planoprotostelium fungivorum]|uniref:C2 domain-containing protein n=1 Tax=Planoprotostelium fungivorum TaxID=1890364 RepID=A0A2P6MZU2_9EUKA|nr:hypothetical protein PROFUN_15769 [Planoprotostelium fungivorum]